MPTPDRPENVPVDAEWDESDREWVVAPKDDAGEKHGDVHYYRPDGSLVSIATYQHGVLEGLARRFHENGDVSQFVTYRDGKMHGKREWFACDEPTTETFYTPQMSRDIVRAEVQCADNRVVGPYRYFTADGVQVEADGSPSKEQQRPGNIPKHAVWFPKTQRWNAGDWNENGRCDGEIRSWYSDGTLAVIERRKDDVVHGPAEMYRPDGTLRVRKHYVDGELEGPVEYFHRNGQLARRVEVAEGRWTSELVDYGENGEEVDRVAAPSIEQTDASVGPTEDESEWLESLHDEVAAEPPPSPGPAGLAELIALGWGGSEQRERLAARRARAFARNHADGDVRDVLAATGLDRAPRLLTAERAHRLLDAFEPFESVDSGHLLRQLVARGGVGAELGVMAGSGLAWSSLRDRLRGDRLDLSNCGLTDLPPELRHLYEVRRLELSRNQLEELPDVVGDLIQLRELTASNNRIQRISPKLARLAELRRLYLDGNGISECPPELLECSELEQLNLGNNALGELPSDFGRLSKLEEIWLNDNPLETLPDSFADLGNLTFLHCTKVAWEEPPAVIWTLEQLETLWLPGPNLKRLPEDIGRLTNLKQLVIWYSGLEQLPDALFEMTHLEQLRVRDNDLPAGTIEALREALPDTKIF